MSAQNAAATDAADVGADAASGSPERDERDLHVEIRRGSPTAEELAAVVAVVTEAYEHEAAAAIAEPEPHPSAWRVSARAMREPLRREIGWGRFGG
ncbi:acyl-CoA carboxylase epsilon subunit [Microbacterium sp. bgisy203]|uniref:acyl-CoA carboxylase epsilon subunit n=1 Tax=Microbacterium sp. bgisy203 TaxID=3413799 RepID=UPI003D70874F